MKNYKNPVKLPPFNVKRVVSILSQNVGWQIVSQHINDVWGITQGEAVKICIIDTGCPVTKKDGVYNVHPDLVGAIDVNNSKTFIKDEGIEDMQGHSTHCAGIIAAQNNQIGMVGVAPKVMITTYKALDRNGTGGMNIINAALEEALKHDFNIISMSLGCAFPNNTMHELIKELYKKNVAVVCAAGNDGIGKPINYPAVYTECVAVGAFDRNGKLADFSCTGEQLDITAPGVDIYSTYLNDTYAVLSGTSMATPFITGIIALMLSKHRKQEKETGKNDCTTVDQIKEHIQKYSTDQGIIGKDNLWGYGIVDIQKLMEMETISNPSTTPVKKITIFQKLKNFFHL